MRVAGIVLGSCLTLGLALIWQAHQTWKSRLLTDLRLRGAEIARAAEGIPADEPMDDRGGEVGDRLYRLLAPERDAAWIRIRDGAGRTRARARGTADGDGAEREIQVADVPGIAGVSIEVAMSTARVDVLVQSLAWRMGVALAALAGLVAVAAWWMAGWVTMPVQRVAAKALGTDATREGSGNEVERLERAVDRLIEERERRMDVARGLAAGWIRAGEDERRRMVDVVESQAVPSLAAIVSILGALDGLGPTHPLAHRVVELRQKAERAMAAMAAMAADLQPAGIGEAGLMDALERYAVGFGRRTGIEIVLEESETDGPRPAMEIEAMAFGVVRESLSNAARHGHARRVRASVRREEGQVRVSVRDDGKGFDVAGWRESGRAGGLAGWEERISALGGTLSVESVPGRGTTVQAEMPSQLMPESW